VVEEAWRSITVVEDRSGEPRVLQQRVTIYASGVSEGWPGYTRPLTEHRLVPMKDVVGL
jgi:hypothetical protein